MYFEMDGAYETGAGRGIDTDLRVAIDPTRVPFRPLGLERGPLARASRTRARRTRAKISGRTASVCHACATFAAPPQQSNGT